MEKHMLSILVKNNAGVVSRISGLFSRRGYNIDSFVGAKTENPLFSRITVTLIGDDAILEQFKKQIAKLVDVVKIIELNPENSVMRDLALIKVNADESKRGAINDIVDIFRCKIVDVAKTTLTIEITGDENKVDALINMLQEYGIKELVRTGLTAVERGAIDINSY